MGLQMNSNAEVGLTSLYYTWNAFSWHAKLRPAINLVVSHVNSTN